MAKARKSANKPFKWPSTEPKPEGKGLETLARVMWEEYYRVIHCCKTDKQRRFWYAKMDKAIYAAQGMELAMCDAAGWKV